MKLLTLKTVDLSHKLELNDGCGMGLVQNFGNKLNGRKLKMII